MTSRRAFSLLLTPLLLFACSDEPPSANEGSCDDVELIVAASDYASSVVCGAPRCEIGAGTSGADLGKDPQLRTSNDRAFFLARDRDLVFEIDPACGKPKARFSVDGAKTNKNLPANAHDIAAAPDGSLFIVLYNAPRIAVVRDGKLEPTPIDLSSYDPDGNPQADAIRIVDVGGAAKAFVSLERLDDGDRLLSKQPSQMLRIDVATRAVEAVIDLAGRNPFNAMAEENGTLYLAEAGNFDSATDELAGIEAFDIATSTTKLLVRERDLGGSVAEVAVTAGCGAAIIAGPQRDINPTSLVTFDPATGRVLSSASAPVMGPTDGYDLQGLTWRGNVLYVGDRRQAGDGYHVHVLERASGGCTLTPTGRTIALPQRPVALRPAGLAR